MSGNFVGETLELVMGQEFLTWLWFKSEDSGVFKDADGNDFSVIMEKRIVVQGGEGDLIETASVSGAMSELREARLGLRTGKKVTRALVRFDQEPESWQFTLKAEDFSLGSFKTPKVESSPEKDDNPEAIFFEKIYLIEKGLSFLDVIYKTFIELRMSAAWKDEVELIQRWLYPDN
ncbi:hypothetical protein LJB93_00270 [Desulfovibrio sp. OttesenSCG-928-F07]|nr:hypothetical protein [Desulfovibrio sp. OttesenSCG-928-F07]